MRRMTLFPRVCIGHLGVGGLENVHFGPKPVESLTDDADAGIVNDPKSLQDQIDSDLLDAQNKREAARRTAQVPTTRRARKYLPVQ